MIILNFKKTTTNKAIIPTINMISNWDQLIKSEATTPLILNLFGINNTLPANSPVRFGEIIPKDKPDNIPFNAFKKDIEQNLLVK